MTTATWSSATSANVRQQPRQGEDANAAILARFRLCARRTDVDPLGADVRSLRRARVDRCEGGGVRRCRAQDLVVCRGRVSGDEEQRASAGAAQGCRVRREGGRRRDPDGVYGDLGVGQTRDRHHRRVRRAARTVADRVTRSKGRGRQRSRSRLRPPSLRNGIDGCGHRRQGVAGGRQASRHAALLRHAGRRGRRRQGLHAPRRSLRRCGCRGHHAPGRSQCGERLEQPGERHGQVSLPWRVGARGGRRPIADAPRSTASKR